MSHWKKALFSLTLALIATPLFAYTIYLRDGSKLIAREAYRIEGDRAIIVLENGTRTSLDASEIDVQRTQRANTSNLGTAIELQNSKILEYSPDLDTPRKETLSDLVARRGPSRQSRPPALRPQAAPSTAATRTRAGYLDYQALARRPYRDLDLATEIQRLFRAQGVGQVLLYQGTDEDHLLVEVTVNSEASVFRTLRVAAGALLHLRENFPGAVGSLELALATSGREPAGQFLLSPDLATRIADGELVVSRFFVDQVRF